MKTITLLAIFVSITANAELPSQYSYRMQGSETWTCQEDQKAPEVKTYQGDYQIARVKDYFFYNPVGVVKVENNKLIGASGKIAGNYNNNEIEILFTASTLRDEKKSLKLAVSSDNTTVTMTGSWVFKKYLDLTGAIKMTSCTYTGTYKLNSL